MTTKEIKTKTIKKNNKKSKLYDNIIYIINLLFIIVWTYILMLNIPPEYIDKYLGGDKVYLKNRLILNQKERVIQLVYFDKDKNKIELAYNVNFNDENKPDIVDKWKYNFFDFFEYKWELLFINLLKKDQNIEKEFEDKLDSNGYVAYYDKATNNLYVFAHNWTNQINWWAIFYKLKQWDKMKFINSLLNFNNTMNVEKRTILKKQDFINNFIDSKGIFWEKNKIYLITCYPNYKSTSRLILVLDKQKEENLGNN